jgi:urease subunit gamma/beta
VLLTPGEQDRLLLFTAAQLARARRDRGLRLNVPEATALIADTVIEAARDGRRLAEAAQAGRSVLGVADVLPGVPDVVGDVMVEAGFDDGTRLVVVTDPFGAAGLPDPGEPGAALRPGQVTTAPRAPDQPPGTVLVEVLNTSEVPVTVTSHWHFFEANPRLRFDRAQAYGRRLAVPAGAVHRFDPGTSQQVALVDYGGDRVVIGFAGLVDGPLDAPGARDRALELARAKGYLGA